MTEIHFSIHVTGLNLSSPFHFFCAEIGIDIELFNYVTREGAGTVEVCANITRGSIDCDIRATLASTDGPKAGTSITITIHLQ